LAGRPALAKLNAAFTLAGKLVREKGLAPPR
jgi:hypothetical protein